MQTSRSLLTSHILRKSVDNLSKNVQVSLLLMPLLMLSPDFSEALKVQLKVVPTTSLLLWGGILRANKALPAALVEHPLRGALWFYPTRTTTLVFVIVSWTGSPKCNPHLQRTTMVLHLRQKWGEGPFLQLFHWGPEAPGLSSLTWNQLYLLWSTTHSVYRCSACFVCFKAQGSPSF